MAWALLVYIRGVGSRRPQDTNIAVLSHVFYVRTQTNYYLTTWGQSYIKNLFHYEDLQILDACRYHWLRLVAEMMKLMMSMKKGMVKLKR